MKPTDYTEAQIKDINERVEKAKILLKGLDLEPRCVVSAVNIGDDVFGLKPQVYLQDIRYTQIVSPIQDVQKNP